MPARSFAEKTFACTVVTASVALAAVAAGLGAVPAVAAAAEASGVDAAAVAQAVGADFTYKDVLGEAVITGYTGAGGKVEIPSTLGLLPVTGIAEGAFSQNHAVTEVVVPEGVTSIGDYAFNDCTSLTSVSLPSTLRSIGKSAFYTCGSLTKIDLPAGVASIGDYAFFGCQSMTSASIPSTVQEWGQASFAYSYNLEKVTIGAGVASVPERAFKWCRSLVSVEMPASVKTVERRAFECCDKLATCDLSHIETFCYRSFACANGVLPVLNLTSAKTIEAEAFSYQQQATTISMPVVQSIGRNAFFGAFSRDEGFSLSIDLPATLTDLADGAFAQTAPSVVAVNVAADNAVYKSEGGVVYSKDGAELLCVPAGYTTADKSFTVPEQVTKVAAWAFSGVNGLSKITVGDNVAEVGEGAFSRCAVSAVTLPAGLAELPDKLFMGASIATLDVPASVKTIGEYALASCANLKSVTLHEGLEAIEASAFDSDAEFSDLCLPASVTSLDPTAFTYDTALTSVSVAEGGVFSAKDGMLFADGGSKLVMVFSSAVKDGCVTIPDGVTTVGSLAFGHVAGTCTVRVPDSVTTIEEKGLSYALGQGQEGFKRDREIYGTANNQALIDYANENCLPVFSQETPTLSAATVELAPGEATDLSSAGILSRVAWVSSDNSVASVDSAGHVTAKAGGEADIFAVAGEKYFSTHVKVSGEAAANPYAGYASITTADAATAWMAANVEYNKPLASSSAELSGIYLYSSENYWAVNAFLEPLGFKATADKTYGAGEYGEFEGIGQNAASELGQFKLHEDVVLYSGLEDAECIEGSGVDVADVAAMAGKELTVKPVLSTSVLQSVADTFRMQTAEKIMLEIYAPKDLTQGAVLGGASTVVYEQEVTFAPGTRFCVLDAGVRYMETYTPEGEVSGREPQRFLKLVPVTGDEPEPEPAPDPVPAPDGDTTPDATANDSANQATNQTKASSGPTPSTGDASTRAGLLAAAAAGIASLAAVFSRSSRRLS